MASPTRTRSGGDGSGCVWSFVFLFVVPFGLWSLYSKHHEAEAATRIAETSDIAMDATDIRFRALERKVREQEDEIGQLQDENVRLRNRIDDLSVRVDELEWNRSIRRR